MQILAHFSSIIPPVWIKGSAWKNFHWTKNLNRDLHLVRGALFQVESLPLSGESFLHPTPYMFFVCEKFFSGALAMPRWPSVSSVGSEATQTSGKSMEQSLLTTCVGSVQELTELLSRTTGSRSLSWTHAAVQALFYFMRCSQVLKQYHSLFSVSIVYLIYFYIKQFNEIIISHDNW